MKIYNFISTLNDMYMRQKDFNGHRFFKNDKYSICVSDTGIEFLRLDVNSITSETSSTNHSMLSFSVYNDKTDHPNNSVETMYGISSFMRRSSGREVVIQNYDGSHEFTIEIPVFDFNEEEIRFSMSTVTTSDLPVAIMSVLQSMDSELNTFYSFRLSEDEVDELIELVEVANAA